MLHRCCSYSCCCCGGCYALLCCLLAHLSVSPSLSPCSCSSVYSATHSVCYCPHLPVFLYIILLACRSPCRSLPLTLSATLAHTPSVCYFQSTTPFTCCFVYCSVNQFFSMFASVVFLCFLSITTTPKEW